MSFKVGFVNAGPIIYAYLYLNQNSSTKIIYEYDRAVSV